MWEVLGVTSSSSAVVQVRRLAVLIASLAAVLVAGLMVVPAAHADHLPAGVSINPHPAQGVPDPVLVPGASLGELNLSIPPTLPDEPDMIPIMPTQSALTTPGLPAIFVDKYTIPGSLLYRTDGVLGNIGGAMELYCELCNTVNQILNQIVWAGGTPPAAQSPLFPPSGGEWRNLTQRGAFEIYEAAAGHDHWHYDTAAVYEILVPGAPARRTAKIGFCMYDTYDTFTHTNYYPSSGGFGWCRPGQPTTSNVRMGISPGVGDYYAAQLTDQWIDITGLDAGPYTLRAEVNPQRFIDESDTTNNVATFAREIPGATAARLAAAATPNVGLTIGLSGAVVAPEIQARSGSNCSVWQASCYIDGTGKSILNAGDGLATLTFTIAGQPANGTLSGPPAQTGDTTATITYTPTPGFVGVDTVTYTTTDERGLTSNPATISISVGSAPANTVAPRVTGSAVVGETLSSTPGEWTGDGIVTVAYQWERCDDAGANCVGVAASTAATHMITSDDVGSTLRVSVTATNPVGAVVAAATATAKVTALRRVKDPKSKIVRSLIVGSKFADFLNGSSEHELFRGLGGPDLIEGMGGSDLGLGGKGRDSLLLGNGPDIAYGGRGRDALKLGPGNDAGYGGRGADLMIGGGGSDTLYGGGGDDKLKIRDGNRDVAYCGNGIDTVIADAIDKIHGSCEIVKLPGDKKLAAA